LAKRRGGTTTQHQTIHEDKGGRNIRQQLGEFQVIRSLQNLSVEYLANGESEECKKKKIKCSGDLPCRRCESHDKACKYIRGAAADGEFVESSS